MARILIATVPVAGHVNPFVPVARALVARGHALCWHTGQKYRARVEATGAKFAGVVHGRDYDDSLLNQAFPERAKLTGLSQLKYDMKHVFIDGAPGQMRDLDDLVRDFGADLVLADPGMIGAVFHTELKKTPTVMIGVLPMVMSSVDTAPFGLGMQPDASTLGRLRNRTLNWTVEHVLFRDVQRHWNQTRASVGLGPTAFWLDMPPRIVPCLQPTIPSFEYARSDLSPNVHFVGMLPPEAPSAWSRPDFWPELDAGKPVIHVTQGTLANESPQLFAPALAGLASEDVLVVVSTGGRAPESLGLGELPRNARISTFLSYPELLPKTSVMVTNGGYGGVQMALSYGVPLVVAGASEDKPEVAGRVAYSGAGLNLKTATPTPERVRAAVRQLLDDPRYRTRARELAAEYARYDAVKRVIEFLESELSS